MINAVVASIDGKAITLREFQAYENGRGRLLPADQRRTEPEFLDGMIEESLLKSEFERQGITADDEDTQYYIDRVLQMNRSSRADVERSLSEIGLTWSDYFERMRFEVEKLALINREIRTRVHVTDEEVERYWRESGAAAEGAGMEVSHIYLALPPLGRGPEANEARARAAEAYQMIASDGFARTGTGCPIPDSCCRRRHDGTDRIDRIDGKDFIGGRRRIPWRKRWTRHSSRTLRR